MQKMNYFKKILVSFFMLASAQGLCLSAPALKELESPIDTIKLYIYKGYVLKELPYVTYTVRMKDKEMGDYINIVKTNCNDMSTGVISTFSYDKSYFPAYNTLDTNIYLAPLKSGAALYNAATYACTSADSYTKTKNKGSSEKDGMGMKILKGTGEVLGTIIVLPFAILGALVGS